MKKQILFSVLAIVATTSVFGQMKLGSAPQPLTCTTANALNPIAGISYTYPATVTNGGTFQWWATTDVNFITAGTNNSSTKLLVGRDKAIIEASSNYGVAGSALNSVDVKWSNATLNAAKTVPTFVVVQNDATSPNCANNLKVYKINPINGFTIDIKNMTQAKVTQAYGSSVAFCVSNIASATYDPATSSVVTNYGTNIMYFEVVAANVTDGYIPRFQVADLEPGQSVTSLELFTDAAFATTAIATTLSSGVYSPAAAIEVDPTVTNYAAGVSLYVKLTINNGTYENLTDNTITLKVDGTNIAGDKDVDNTDCSVITEFGDVASQILTKRPTIVAPVTGQTFVTP